MDTIVERTAQGTATHFIQPLHGSVSGEPRIIVSGKGVEITDSTGKTFIDSFAGLWNVNVGFGRAELAQAAYEQMTKIAYCSSYSGQATEPALKLVDRLLKLTYPNLDAVYLTSGGAESNESAFKTARYYWYRQGKPDKVKIVARMRSYHGTTIATMTATGQPAYWPMFGPKAPGFVHVEPTDQYRNPKTGREYAKALEDKILEEGPETVAAFIAEPVVGGAGLLVPPDDYFPAIREICDKYDVLLIADEVITGFGRTGKWFALEHWGVQPDIMSFAKGVTSGYFPLGGIMTSAKIAEAIRTAPADQRWMHAYTYSAHPTGCAVALANLDIIEREGLVDNAAEMGRRLLDGLRQLEAHPNVGHVRGLGLMAGVELTADKATKAPFAPEGKLGAKVAELCIERGLIMRNRGDIMQMSPPLSINANEVDRIVNILSESIQLAAKGL